MIWEILEDDIKPVQPSTFTGTVVGSVGVYHLNGKTYLETTELVGMPGLPNKLMEKRLRDLVLLPILSLAGVDIRPFKLRTLKETGKDIRFNRPKKIAEPEPVKKPLERLTKFEGKNEK